MFLQVSFIFIFDAFAVQARGGVLDECRKEWGWRVTEKGFRVTLEV